MIKKILPYILGFIIIFTPSFLVMGAPLVPDCNSGEINVATGNFKNACDFNTLITLVNNVINFILFYLATPLFALITLYVGWLYLSDMGSAKNVEKSKSIFKNVLFGYVIALAAWLIVHTIIGALGFKGDSFLK